MNKTLLKFTSSSCTPCKALQGVIEALQQEQPEVFTDVVITEVLTDTERTLTKAYGVRSVPMLILLDSTGEELKRTMGSLSKEKLKEFLL